VIHCPPSPLQLFRHTRPSAAGECQRNPLHSIAQLHVFFPPASGRKTIKPGTTDPGPIAHLPQIQFGFLALAFDLLVNSGFPVNACSLRCSSMRCKHPCKKSISRVCCPTLRSSSAIRPSGQRALPFPGNALPGLDLSPILRQPVKTQNTANGGFESWDSPPICCGEARVQIFLTLRRSTQCCFNFCIAVARISARTVGLLPGKRKDPGLPLPCKTSTGFFESPQKLTFSS
jgi:hypothetical protein